MLGFHGFKRRKAVSPVISALLLLVITIFGSSIVTIVSLRWIDYQRTENLVTFKERLVIEDVWFKSYEGRNQDITIRVRNIGNIDITVLYCDVNHNQFNLKLFLKPGQHGDIQLTGGGAQWYPGTNYTIIVTTERGNSFRTYETP